MIQMKKFFWFTMALIMMIMPIAAMAAGKASVTQECLFVTGTGSYDTFVFAEIKNIGDKPLSLDGGVIEVLDKDGNTIGNATYLSFFPSVLAPGETGYMCEDINVVGATATSKAVDHMLTVTGKSESHWYTQKIESSGIITEEENFSNVERYVDVIIKNNTEQPIIGPSYVYALYDKDGNLLFARNGSLYDIILPPQQTVIVRTTLYSDYTNIWEAKGVKPERVETIVYDMIYK